MRIVCPNCAAAYEVPEGRVRPGRDVRCARCSALWMPVPPVAAVPDGAGPVVPEPVLPVAEAFAAPEPVVPEPVMPEPVMPEPVGIGPVVPGPVSPEPAVVPPAVQAGAGPARAGALPVLGAWLFSLAVLAGAGWYAVVHRDAVMQAWPPSERAYQALGLVSPR